MQLRSKPVLIHHHFIVTPSVDFLTVRQLLCSMQRIFGCTPNFWTVCLSTHLGLLGSTAEQMGSFASRSSA